MKTNTLSVIVMALILMAGSAAPALSFDFIRGYNQYTQSTEFPPEASAGDELNQFVRELIQNIRDFTHTHPGTRTADYFDARSAANLFHTWGANCNLPATRPGYVTDGHSGTYHRATLRPSLYGDWTRVGFVDCGKIVRYISTTQITIDGVTGADTVELEIEQDLTTGVFTGWVFSHEQGEDYIFANLNIRTLDDLMSRLNPSVNAIVGVDDIVVTRAGIAQPDFEDQEITPANAWMSEVANSIGLGSTDWRSGTGSTSNVMYIDYQLDGNSNITHAWYVVTLREDGTYVIHWGATGFSNFHRSSAMETAAIISEIRD